MGIEYFYCGHCNCDKENNYRHSFSCATCDKDNLKEQNESLQFQLTNAIIMLKTHL